MDHELRARRVVDSIDQDILGMAWGSIIGEPNHISEADLNGDGVVDSTDYGILGANWEHYGHKHLKYAQRKGTEVRKKIPLTWFASSILFSALFGILFLTPVKAQTSPTVTVTFPNTTNSSFNEYRVGDTFRVDIVVNSPDIGIWSWQAGIYFDNNILVCTELGEGTFFAGKCTLGFQNGTIHNDLGYVTFSGNSLRDPETTGVKGTGVLMWFEFYVKGYGTSILNLTLSPPDLTCGTKLNEKVNTSVVPISPIIPYDGSFDNTGLAPVGGIWIPVNKLELLAPYIGLTILLTVAVMTIGYVKKRKRDAKINS